MGNAVALIGHGLVFQQRLVEGGIQRLPVGVAEVDILLVIGAVVAVLVVSAVGDLPLAPLQIVVVVAVAGVGRHAHAVHAVIVHVLTARLGVPGVVVPGGVRREVGVPLVREAAGGVHESRQNLAHSEVSGLAATAHEQDAVYPGVLPQVVDLHGV